MESIYNSMLEVIKTGSIENPVLSKDLMTTFNINERDLRLIISHLRTVDNKPVLSSTHGQPGYYWPKSPDDAIASYSHLINRIRNLNKAIKGIEKGLIKEFGNQLVLEELIKDMEAEDKNNV